MGTQLPPKKGHSPSPNIWLMSIMAKRSPISATADSSLEFNVPFQDKYGYIRDERSGMESYPYPVKEG